MIVTSVCTDLFELFGSQKGIGVLGSAARCFCSAVAFFVQVNSASPAAAHEVAFGNLLIGHPWSRATPQGAEVGGAYFTVTNKGEEPDTLLSATSQASDRLEIHDVSMSGDIMKMGIVTEPLVISPGETLTFQPGGRHMMMFGLHAPLTTGSSFEVDLKFERAGLAKVVFSIEKLGAKTPSAEHVQ